MVEAVPMSESMHARYDRDERQLVATAADDLWSDELLDAIVDVASPIMAASAWHGLPDGAAPGTTERYAVSSLMAVGLRGARSAALLIRAGYAAEGLAAVRRLFEAAGHAQRVAEDESGQYAENWLTAQGKAAKPRAAFGAREDASMWNLMSGQAHAGFGVYAHLSATLDEGRLIHQVGPHRDAFWDSMWIWLVARQLSRVLAAVLKVHPHIDQSDFLLLAERLVLAEQRIEAEIAQRREA
jgi:hypothetical protein